MKNFLIIVTCIGLILIAFLVINGINKREEIEITFLSNYRHCKNTLSGKGYLNAFDWVIISSLEQRKNWKNAGYSVPTIDFNQEYLIISRYRIDKLFESRKDHCSGVPIGVAVFNMELTDDNYYYFYIMPKIMLTQGVG